MKRITIIAFCFIHQIAYTQTKHKVAVFLPLYIEEAFNGNTFNVAGNYLPKQMLPGLEFYNGLMFAVDSLNKAGIVNIELNIFDTKSSNKTIESIVTKEEFKQTQLIIACFTNKQEIKTLATYANQQKIPIVSATYPNDGGVSNNPYFFLLNPTLRTHCKGLLQFIQRNYTTSNVVFVTKQGGVEDAVKAYFDNSATELKNTSFNSNTTYLTDSFSVKQLTNLLDSNKQNVIICGSISDNYLLRIINSVEGKKKYKTTVFALPTTDALKALDRGINKEVPVIYSSAYNFDTYNALQEKLKNRYYYKYNGKASDMMLKGYETMLRFGRGVALYGNTIIDFLGDDSFKVFNTLQLEPITTTENPDYYENKKLYFIQKLGGLVKILY